MKHVIVVCVLLGVIPLEAQTIAGSGARFQVGGTAVTEASSGQGAIFGLNGVTASNNPTDSVLTIIQSVGGGGGAARLISDKTGTQAYVPLAFLVNGAEAMRLTTAGNIYLGNTTSDASLGAPTFLTFGNNSGLVAATATTNASTAGISVNGTSASLTSDRTGSGTRLPLVFNQNGVEVGRFTAVNGTQQLFINGSGSVDWGVGNGAVISANGVTAANTTTNAVMTTLRSTGGGGGTAGLYSEKTGTQAYVPLAFYTNATLQMTLTTGGDLQLAAGFLDTKTGGSVTISTGVGSVRMSTANAATNTVWIPIKYNGTTYYVPGYTTNAP